MLSITKIFEQDDEALPVEMVQNDDGSCTCICPHCGKELDEEEISYDEENDSCVHDLCGGEIIMPDNDSDDDDDDDEDLDDEDYM